MSIRFRKYAGPRAPYTKEAHVVSAIKLTERNVAEVVAYINKNKGTALDESKTFKSDQYKDGVYTAVKVSLVQKNVDIHGKVKKGVRKAFGGDLIVRTEVELPSGKSGYEFSRIRDAGIDGYSLVG